jgi:outer membrane protein insertion porin family/translocation and assembly module TamA
VSITGNAAVETEVLEREIAFEPGEPFRQSLLDRTRTNLVGLGLFSSVRVTPKEGPADRVDVEVEVGEGPPRSVRLGVGYDSEEQVRGLASWRHYNFLGGARQAGVAARYSLLRRSVVADLLQPHFPTQRTRIRLIALQQREDEDSYLLDRTRGTIRGEWEPIDRLVAHVFYRGEYASLSEVSLAVARAVPDAIPKNAVLSSIGMGLDWAHTDDPFDPTRGVVLRTAVEPVGGALGGDVDFVRVIAEGRGYVPIRRDTVAAVRLRMGTASTFAGTRDVPLYERFFSGGTDSVRGYERWHVGPLAGGDPVGGKSLVEGSIELRHRVTESLALAAFLDGGQVDRRSWRASVDDLQIGTGFGVRYRTPIGPIRVDLGFPLDRPRGDASWQVHFTVGPSF